MIEPTAILETEVAVAEGLTPTTQSRFARWSRLLAQFLTGQICVQFLGVVTGFFMLRWLSVKDYAQFGVAFAFQSAFNILVDLGFAGSIIALVGDRGGDKAVVGNYLRAAQTLRGRLTVFGILVSCVVFPSISIKQGWSLPTTLLLLGGIFLAVIAQKWIMYEAPLIINGHLKPYYSSQIAAAFLRLVGCGLLHLVGGLTAWIAVWIGGLTIAFNGFFYRVSARPFITEPIGDSSAYCAEIKRYVAPMMPAVIFTVFQGQVSIALISIFGHTRNIAEIAALGRLGQIFLALGAFNSIIVVPFIAKVGVDQLKRRYFQVFGGSLLLATGIALIGAFYPQPFLWLLGAKYQNLEVEVSWSIAISCVSYIAGVLWSMNCARKWVFWWASIFEIVLLLSVEVVCALRVDLSRTLGVIYLSVAMSLANLVVHLVIASYGFFHLKKTPNFEP